MIRAGGIQVKQTLLVKHAVGGRMFIDSNRQDVSFMVEIDGDGWLFDIRVSWSADIEELLAWKDELNVFIFKEYDDQPTLKTWYYVGQGPVEYDKQSQRLAIRAESSIEYYPHEYSV